jgi:hypothetical protein
MLDDQEDDETRYFEKEQAIESQKYDNIYVPRCTHK